MDREAEVHDARRLFLEAPFDTAAWRKGLEAFSDACGASLGQLIGQGSDTLDFNWLTGIDPDDQKAVETNGLLDPLRNPRLRAGRAGQPLELLADQHYLKPDDRKRYPIYEVFDRLGFSFNCQTVILREPGRLIRTSISRSSRQGPFADIELRNFLDLAPDIQSAARFQSRLDNQAKALLAGILDAIDCPTMLLDERFQVVELTGTAAQLLTQSGQLQVRMGRLVARTGENQRALDAALGEACAARIHGLPFARTPLRLTGPTQDLVLDLEFRPLPYNHFGGFRTPTIVVLVRLGRKEAWRSRFGLSKAEATVATALARGQSPAEISAARGRSLATIRSQVMTVYEKTGVHRHAELSALLLPMIEATAAGVTSRFVR